MAHVMDALTAATFFVDLAERLREWFAAGRALERAEKKELAEYLTKIADVLNSYAEALTATSNGSNARAIQDRYYLEAALSNLAWQINRKGADDRLAALVGQLRRIKVHDGALVPEVTALIEGPPVLAADERLALLERIHRAVGEFRATADALAFAKNA